MIGWQREQIIKRYKRKVAAHPDGEVVHDGDCGLFNAYLGVCTCGLHHMLMIASSEDVKELYPKYIEEKCNDGFIYYLLQEFERNNLYVKDEEKFVKVERPKRIPIEEFNKIMRETFGEQWVDMEDEEDE